MRISAVNSWQVATLLVSVSGGALLLAGTPALAAAPLQTFACTDISYANCISITPVGLSADGDVVLLKAESADDEGIFLWSASGGAQLVFSNSDVGDLLMDAAGDTVALGTSDGEAYRWTEAEGLHTITEEGGVVALSADGTIVAGNSDPFGPVANQGYRWVDNGDGTGVLTLIGGLDPENPESSAWGMTPDGAYIDGVSHAADGGYYGFVWDAQSQTMTELQPLVSGTTYTASTDPDVMTADGSFLAGESFDGMTNDTVDWQAARWTADGAVEGLGYLGTAEDGSHDSEAALMTPDGTIIAGTSTNSSGDDYYTEAFRWVDDGNGGGSMTGLGMFDTAHDNHSWVDYMTADGDTILGGSENFNGVDTYEQGFRWTATDGFMRIGTVDGDMPGSEIDGWTPDGTVLVGANYSPFTYDTKAFRWSVDAGMQSIPDWLGPDVDTTGIDFLEADFVSADGTVVAGQMTDDGSSDDVDTFLARVTDDDAVLVDPDELAHSAADVASTSMALGIAGDGDLDNLAQQSAGGHQGGVSGFLFGNGAFGDDDLNGGAGLLISNEHASVGLAALGTRAWTDPFTAGGGGSATGYGVGLTAGYGGGDGLQLTGALIAEYVDAQIRRGYHNGATAVTGQGDTSGTLFGGEIQMGYRLGAGKGMSVTPFGALSAVATHLVGYTETSGPLPATFSAQDELATRARLGVEATIALGSDLDLGLLAAYGHRFEGNGAGIDADFDGLMSVGVPGAALGQDWGEAGVSITYRIGDTATASASATATYGSSTEAAYRLSTSLAWHS